jgi:hypothetical protein
MAVLRLHSSSFHFRDQSTGYYLYFPSLLALNINWPYMPKNMPSFRWLLAISSIVVKKMRKDQAKLVFYKDLRSLRSFFSLFSYLQPEGQKESMILEFIKRETKSRI